MELREGEGDPRHALAFLKELTPRLRRRRSLRAGGIKNSQIDAAIREGIQLLQRISERHNKGKKNPRSVATSTVHKTNMPREEVETILHNYTDRLRSLTARLWKKKRKRAPSPVQGIFDSIAPVQTTNPSKRHSSGHSGDDDKDSVCACWQADGKLTPCGYTQYMKYKKECPPAEDHPGEEKDQQLGNQDLSWDSNPCNKQAKPPTFYNARAVGYERCATMRQKFKELCGADESHEYAIKKMKRFSKACKCKSGQRNQCK